MSKQPESKDLLTGRPDRALSLHALGHTDDIVDVDALDEKPATRREVILRFEAFSLFVALVINDIYDHFYKDKDTASDYFQTTPHQQNIINLLPQLLVIIIVLSEKACCRPAAVDSTVQEPLLVQAPRNNKAKAARAVVPYLETTASTYSMITLAIFFLVRFENPEDLLEHDGIESVAPTLLHMLAAILHTCMGTDGYSIDGRQLTAHILAAGLAAGVTTGLDSDGSIQFPSFMPEDSAQRTAIVTVGAMLTALVAAAAVAPKQTASKLSNLGSSMRSSLKNCCRWLGRKCERTGPEITEEASVSEQSPRASQETP